MERAISRLTTEKNMNFCTRFITNFLWGVALIMLLVFFSGCASQTNPAASAEPPACRGTAFSINQPSQQTAGVQ
jgi:hypothetical protein